MDHLESKREHASPGPGEESVSRCRPRRKSAITEVLWEGVLVGAIGAVFALAANAVSPRSLSLGRDYFPSTVRHGAPSATDTNRLSSVIKGNSNVVTGVDPLAARLRAKGLQLMSRQQVEAHFRDPRYEQELIVFVDARDDQHYAEGHIPGAYQLDHYRADNYLGVVLPACQTAEVVVVYCNGGDCEDSEFAAITLSQGGIPSERLWIFGGGMTDWATNGLPVEVGTRKSGDIRNASP